MTYLFTETRQVIRCIATPSTLKMEDETHVDEVSNEKGDRLQDGRKAAQSDSDDHGFTCNSNANKRFFIDDTEEQNVTKPPQVVPILD